MLPNVIIGIGQAGKELTFELLKQDWIVERALRKEKGIGFVKSLIIDTATGEAPDDLNTISEIENNIREHSKDIGKPVDIKIKYVCIPWEIQLNTPSELRDTAIVNSIKEKMGIDVWWIEDKNAGLKDWFKELKEFSPSIENDFRGGTYRNRAITKAVFYKAIYEGVIDFDYPGDDAAIIVGLGGGTGSGMFIDVAKMLEKNNFNVTLFAVLPTTHETAACKANAFAALSELEYLNLTNESPFNTIVLLPIEESRYATAPTSILDDYDEAFPYIFTNFYHPAHKVKDTITRDHYGNYTGFINSTTFSIKYDIENLIDFKNLLTGAINFLKDSREEEEKYRNRIKMFFDEIEELVPRNEEAMPFATDVEYLHNKIKSLTIWDEKVFEIVGIKMVKDIKNEISYYFKSQKINSNEWPMDLTELENRVNIIINLVQRFESHDTDEKKIRDEILRNFQIFIEQIKQLRISVELNLNDDIKKIVSDLVKVEEINPDNILSLNAGMELTRSDIKKIKVDQQKTKDSIQKLNHKMSASKELIRTLVKHIEIDVEQISHLESFKDINKIYFNLVDELNKESVKKVKDESEWISKFNGLTEQFPNDFKQYIEDLLVYVYYYRREVHFKNMVNDKSLRNKFRRGRKKVLLDEAEKYETRKQTQQKVVRARYPNWKISFNTTTNDVLTTDFDPQEVLKEKSSNLLNKIDKYLIDNKCHININEIINIEDGFSQNSDVNEGVFKKFEDAIKSDVLNQFEHDLNKAICLENELCEKMIELQTKSKYLSLIQTLHDNSIAPIRSINSDWNSFGEKFEEINKRIKQSTGHSKVEGFKCTIYPDPTTIRSTDENINIILDSDISTKNTMISFYQQFISTIITSTYNGLSNPKPKYICDDGEKYWRIKKAVVVVNTCEVMKYSLKGSEIEKELQRTIAQKLGVERITDIQFLYIDDGNEWVTSATIFISPTFMDQLYPIQDYFADYEKLKEKNGKQNILPHTLMLEEGIIVRRKRVIEQSDSARFASETWEGDKDISKQIINDEYEPKNFTNSVRSA